MAYIDVVAVKKAVKDGALVTKVVDGNILLADVKSGEAAKIGELPVGRWIFTQEYSETLDIDLPWATCSACREYRINSAPFIKKPNYCPLCGAKMKGENDG